MLIVTAIALTIALILGKITIKDIKRYVKEQKERGRKGRS